MSPRYRPLAPSWPTVALTLTPAYSMETGEVVLSGLYDVEDADSTEQGSWFNVVQHGTSAEEPRWYAVDIDVLLEQVDPRGYGARLVEEHESMLADEDYYMREHLEVHPGAWRTVQLQQQREGDNDEAESPALER